MRIQGRSDLGTPALGSLAGGALREACQAECEFRKITRGQLAAAWRAILYKRLPNSTLFLGCIQLSKGDANFAESCNSQLQAFGRVFMCMFPASQK